MGALAVDGYGCDGGYVSGQSYVCDGSAVTSWCCDAMTL